MRKAAITISYDEEKLNALRLYLEQKGMQPEAELTKALDALFTKSVPANVRDFIEMRAGASPAAEPKPSRRPKPAPPSTAAAEQEPGARM